MERSVTVKGTGKISRRPDIIIVPMTLSVGDANYERCAERGNELMSKLRDRLNAVGIDSKELKTAEFGISPRYESRRDKNGNYFSVFSEYRYDHRMKLTLPMDMELLSMAVTAISGCGEDTQFDIRFGISDTDSAQAEMLENAAKNAREKAQILCAASGVRLGELVSIDYNWAELMFTSEACLRLDEVPVPCAKIELEPEDVKAEDTAVFRWTIL